MKNIKLRVKNLIKEKDVIINTLRFNYAPNLFELQVISELINTNLDMHTVIDLFNFGKQCRIRQERSRKKK